MSVEISRLQTEQQRNMAAAADRATGRPDNRTSVEEIDGYLKANAILNDRPNWSWNELIHAVRLLATDDRLAPARRAELVRIAVAHGGDFDRRDRKSLADRGVTDDGERAWVERLAQIYVSVSRNTPRDLVAAIDALAADGEISSADREAIVDASRRVAQPAVPQSDEIVAAHALPLAERRGRVFRAIYGDAVQAGLVTGVSPKAQLQPPSAEAANAIRDGSLVRQLIAAPRDNLPQLLARVERAWPRFGPDLDRLADELTREWDTRSASVTSPARTLAALLPMHAEYSGSKAPLEKPEQRAALAAAVVQRLSDAQLAALEPRLTATLVAALAGGGQVRHAPSAVESSTEGYVVPRAVNGPRTFAISKGRGEIQEAQLARLRNATAATFEWRPRDANDYYSPSFGTLVERAQ